jgi:alpha-N-arabinofuranosidase
MTADYYLSQLKIYSHFVRNDNPSPAGRNQMLKIAVGPGEPETEWTETIMKAWQHHDWTWDIDGLSLHSYTVPNGWPPSTPSTGLRRRGVRQDAEVHACSWMSSCASRRP